MWDKLSVTYFFSYEHTNRYEYTNKVGISDTVQEVRIFVKFRTFVENTCMHYKDITTDTQTQYRLTEPGTFVFFLKNRSGDITFSIDHSDVIVHIFCVFDGEKNENFFLNTVQRHTAPNSESHMLVKSVLKENSKLYLTGNIFITKDAMASMASFANKNLLVGEKSSAETKPSLEILADDVQCSHSATTAPLNPSQIHYLQGRGLSQEQAEKLLIEGFLKEVGEKIQNLKNTH